MWRPPRVNRLAQTRKRPCQLAESPPRPVLGQSGSFMTAWMVWSLWIKSKQSSVCRSLIHHDLEGAVNSQSKSDRPICPL